MDLNYVKNFIKSTIDNGVVTLYYDHLSMDAHRVFIIENHNIIIESDVLMFSDSSYYGTIGICNTLKRLKEKYPDYRFYYCSIGWYTFPQKWRIINNVKETASELNCEVFYINFLLNVNE